MTVEDKIKFQIGDLIVATVVLKDQLDKANERIKELEARAELKPAE
jgi:hypothetical protein